MDTNNKVILYSTGCPKCKVLKKKLDSSTLEYVEVNDKEEMEKLSIDSVPVLSVYGKLLKFSDAVKYVNEYIK